MIDEDPLREGAPAAADPNKLGHDPRYELMLLVAKDVERYMNKLNVYLERERQLKEEADEEERQQKQRERNIKFDIPEDIDDENFNADGGRGSVEVAPTPPPAVDYSKEYTPIERVEIFEAGGVSAFFMGDYKDSESHLKRAYDFLQKILFASKGDASTTNSLKYNISAEKYISEAISFGENYMSNNKDGSSSGNKLVEDVNKLLAMCYSNYALIKYSTIDTDSPSSNATASQHIVRDCIEKGRSGVELAAKIYGGTLSSHQQYLNHVRSLLSIYLKLGDLAKAEALIDDTKFPPNELAILRSGVKFLGGKYDSALQILRKSQKENYSNNEIIVRSSNSDEEIVSRWKSDIFESLNLYNMNVFRVINSDHSKSVTVQTMNKLILILENIIVENKTIGEEQGNIVSLMDKCSEDTFPNYYSYDNYLFLAAFLAHVFMSKIEMLLLSDKSEDAENLHKLTLFANNAPKNKYDDSFDVNTKTQQLLTGMRDSVLKIGGIMSELMPEKNNNNLLLDRHSINDRLRMIGHLSDMVSVTNNYSYEMESDLSTVYSLRLSEILRSQFGYNINDKTGQKLIFGSKESKGGGGVITADNYISSRHDKFTVSNDIFQIVSMLGNDERSVLVQWALCQGGGSVWAFLEPRRPRRVKSWNGSNLTNVAKKMADSYLKEVRLRLVEADNDIVAKFRSCGMKYSHGEREMRVILNVLIVKLSAQFGSKKDCESYLSEAEILVQMYRPNCKEHDKCDFLNIAIVKRMRVDLEEWNLASLVNNETRLNAQAKMLNIAKEYLSAAQKSADCVMVRDAFRRVINIYVEIHNAPYASPTFSLGSNEKLQLYTEDDINEREVTNVEFVKSFAKVRAGVFMSRFKMYFREAAGSSGASLGRAASLASVPAL